MIRRLLAALLLLAPTPAFAWWDHGHRIVASIADQYLTPTARREVAKLIANDRLLETPSCRIRSIEDASTWADCIKPLGDRFAHAASWHYQNVPICRPFNDRDACRDGNCVSAQIRRNARMLADTRLPMRERVQAFAFLTHFVGDLHQPLHAGDNADRGGNDVKADYGAISHDRLNLHAIWDGHLAERTISEPPGGVAGLISEITPADRAAYAGATVRQMAEEAHALSRDIAYGKLPIDANVCETKPTERVKLREPYVADSRDALRLQVKRAGVRLAQLLNETLDPAARPEGRRDWQQR